MGGFSRRVSRWVLLLNAAVTAGAACPDQWLVSNSIPGAAGGITAMLPFDDGTGPALYFSNAGLVGVDVVGLVGRRRQQAWEQAPGWEDRFDGRRIVSVTHMIEFRGELIVAGTYSASDLTSSTVTFMRRWNGTEWFDFLVMGIGQINALAVYRDELYVGGQFNLTSPVEARNIMRWNGTTWNPVHEGRWSAVLSFAHYRDLLIAATARTDIWLFPSDQVMAWNGSAWQRFGSQDPFPEAQRITAIAEYQGGLLVSGRLNFRLKSTSTTTFDMALWDGTAWRLPDFPPIRADRLLVAGDELFASRDLSGTVEPGAATLSVLKPDGWQPVECVETRSHSWIRSIVDFEQMRFIGGYFNTACDPDLYNLVAFRDQSPVRMTPEGRSGFDSNVSASARIGDELVVGGTFTRIGDVPAWLVAGWNGQRWRGIGEGATAFPHDAVGLVVEHLGEIVVTGRTYHGPEKFPRIAKWNGVRWVAIDRGLPFKRLRTLYSYGGQLYAGAEYDPALPPDAIYRYLLSWDGTTWDTSRFTIAGRHVAALQEYQGLLYVGGDFTWANGQLVNHVFSTDGVNVFPIEAGVSGHLSPHHGLEWSNVTVLHVHDDLLLIGGQFRQPEVGLIAWNGAQRQPGRYRGRTLNDFYPRGLSTFREQLLACTDGALCRWEDGDWRRFGDCFVSAGIEFDNTLFVNTTSIVDGAGYESYLSRYGSPGSPGDSNSDDAVDFADIDCFVAALVDERVWRTCSDRHDAASQAFGCANDINQDGSINADDIDGFIGCVVASGCR